MRKYPLWKVVATMSVFVLCTTPLQSQGRSLFWPEISIDARLDADGRLHVVERQTIRFSGDWNGGYRAFDLEFGQDVTVTGLERLDTLSGEWMPLIEGDLDRVDGYDWVEGQLRWRSRSPNDPPFDSDDLTYRLHFTYDNVLQPQGGDEYLLDHNFAFANRDGIVSRFQVNLEVDPAWRVPEGFTGRYEAGVLAPGENFVVNVPLTRVAAAPPAGVKLGAPTAARYALAAALVAAFIGLFMRLMKRERRLGRAEPLMPRSQVTPEWLGKNVFAHRPEVVGAAWDDSTAAPEVAATLARLVQEKKLSSSVREKGALFFKSHVLSLRLEVRRNAFTGYERQLIDALFDPGSETTDTERVRERYKKTGFDPAALIRKELAKRVDVLSDGKGEAPSRIPGLVLVALALALLIAGGVARQEDIPVAVITVAISLFVYFISLAFAHAWRGRVSNIRRAALWFLVPMGALLAAFTYVVLVANQFRVGVIMVAGLTLWMIALVHSVLNFAASRQSPERIAKRKELAAAREFFEEELGKPEPALEDEWFPYVLAFGLGPHIDRWFDSFGGERHNVARSGISSGAAVASSASSRGGGWTGFGGGGGFGGAGGGASFGAALGSMAAAVPSPSSGSGGGGGGGGGGGSSGGGGGGGW